MFIFFAGFSQNDTLFFDKNWKPCKKIKAEYYRIIRPDSSGFIVKDYYVTNQIQMTAVCSKADKDTIIYNGHCAYYNKLGFITSQGIYTNNLKTGFWTFSNYTDKGEKYNSGFMKNELLDSIFTDYYPSGNIYSTSSFKDDTLNGIKISFRDDGSINYKSYYLNGKLNGWYTEYRKSGVKHIEAEYVNGKMNGNQVLYFENGQKQGDFFYTKRKVDGYKIWYYENGEIQSKVIFTNGKRKKIIRSGKLLKRST